MFVQFRLSAASKKAVNVHYATANRTAVAGTDYAAASGTLKIAAGKRSGSVTVRLHQPVGHNRLSHRPGQEPGRRGKQLAYSIKGRVLVAETEGGATIIEI